MSEVHLAFPVSTQRPIPVDHGYALFSAISRVLPELHREHDLAIHPLRGRYVGDRQVMLTPWSLLMLRLAVEKIAHVLPLAGATLGLGQSTLRIGVPRVRALEPATVLRSRLTVIKVAHIHPGRITAVQFAHAARRQLDERGISAGARLTLGKRRTLRIKSVEIVGYELIVAGLSAEDSLVLQRCGLGGRQHMGCGVFTAFARSRECAS